MRVLIDLMKSHSIARLKDIAAKPNDNSDEVVVLKRTVAESCQDLITSQEYIDASSSPQGAADVIFKTLENNIDDVDSDLLRKLEFLCDIAAPGVGEVSAEEGNYHQVLIEVNNCVQQSCLTKTVNKHGGYVNAISAFITNAKDKSRLRTYSGDPVACECYARLLALETKLNFLCINPTDEVFDEINDDLVLLLDEKYSDYIGADVHLVTHLSRAKDFIRKEIFLTNFFPGSMSLKQQKEVETIFSSQGNNYSKFLKEFLSCHVRLEDIPNCLDQAWCVASSLSDDDSLIEPGQYSPKEIFERNLIQFQIHNAYRIYHAQMSLRIDDLFNQKVHEIEQSKLDTFPTQQEFRKKLMEEYGIERSEEMSPRKWGSQGPSKYAKYASLTEQAQKLQEIETQYQSELKRLHSEAKQEARLALTNEINEAAKATMLAFIKFIQNYIERAKWKTGILGGESVTINGKKVKLPKNVYAIYKKCLSIPANAKVEDVQKVFNEIMYMGKKADEKTGSFLGLNKRDEITRRFYMFFRNADEAKAKYVQKHPEHIFKPKARLVK